MDSHICVMPSDVVQCLVRSHKGSHNEKHSNEPRMLYLPHPRTGLSSLFLPTEWLSTSEQIPLILEVQAVSPPDERSWIREEEVIADGKLLIMTPVDPSFLLIRIMEATQPLDGSTPQFKPADDLFDEAARVLGTPSESATSPSFEIQDLLDFCSLLCVRKHLSNVCDMKEITPELIVYRYSQSKTIEYMRTKVVRLSKSHAFERSHTLIRHLAKEGLMEDGKEELLALGRLRSACDLISQYLPPALNAELVHSYDFSKLQMLLDSNKEELVANAANSSNSKQAKAQKTTAAAEKKRKAQKPSVGVEKLKKVNTTGMAKLSSFFSKA